MKQSVSVSLNLSNFMGKVVYHEKIHDSPRLYLSKAPICWLNIIDLLNCLVISTPPRSLFDPSLKLFTNILFPDNHLTVIEMMITISRKVGE